MKIAIIGAGHIGSAIVTCLAQGHLYNEKDIIVSNQISINWRDCKNISRQYT